MTRSGPSCNRKAVVAESDRRESGAVLGDRIDEMKTVEISSIGLLLLLATMVDATPGEASWLPESCSLVLELENDAQAEREQPEESDDARWNRFYRLGIDAISRQDLEQAQAAYCLALDAAGSFGPRDVRFAETLDELGLVAFMREDYVASEAMQGAAVAEMLLALGPPAPDLEAEAAESCASSVATYMSRLGWIFERQERAGEIDALMREPYRILERGYVPFESVATRLDWLIARYLLAEDFIAADWLSSWRDALSH